MTRPSEENDPTASLPRVPSDLSKRLRQQHGDDVDPNLTLPNPEDDPARVVKDRRKLEL